MIDTGQVELPTNKLKKLSGEEIKGSRIKLNPNTIFIPTVSTNPLLYLNSIIQEQMQDKSLNILLGYEKPQSTIEFSQHIIK
jgi:hypothetical protein